jgi:hypothetical protein
MRRRVGPEWLVVFAMILGASCGGGGGSSGTGGSTGMGGGAGGGAGVTDGGAGGVPDGGTTTGGRAFCPGSLATTPYLGLGDSCGSGSNDLLCVFDEPNCQTGLCLWDQADPTRERSYCTIACQMGTAGACPAGFDCRAESCESKTVCVRTQVPTTTTSPGLDIHAGVFPSASLKFALGMLGDKSYWIAGNGIAWERAADGTMSQLTGSVAGGLRNAYAVPDGDSLMLWIDANDIFVGRISNGALTTVKWSTGANGLFRTQDGTIYMLQASVGGAAFAPVMPDLTRSTDLTRFIQVPAGPTPFGVYPLRDFGFVGPCTQGTATDACASADGRTIADLGPVEIDGALARQSYRPDHIWMPVPGGLDVMSELALWNGTTWIKESLEPSYQTLIGQLTFTPTIVGLVPLSRTDDRLLVFIGDDFDSTVAYAAAGCFTPLYAVGAPYSLPYDSQTRSSIIQTAPDTIEWAGGSVDVDFLSTSAFAQAPLR